MALIDTITDESKLFHDLRQTDSYKNSFSYTGANALQAYLDNLSEELGEDIEWDPIAWCVSYSEYADFETFKADTAYIVNDVEHEGYDNIKSLDDLRDNTTVIEFDGGIIVEDF